MHTAEDGVVVFDADTHCVHYLNPTATFVFSLSNWTGACSEIAELLRAAWVLDASPVEEVGSCIEPAPERGGPAVAPPVLPLGEDGR